MFPVVAVINHLLEQEPWAQQRLRRHADAVARFVLPLGTWTLRITTAGLVEDAPDDVSPSVVLNVSAEAFGALLSGGQAAMMRYVRIDGDAELANTISQLAAQLRWEPDEDLARWLGDPLAHRLGEQARRLHEGLLRGARSVASATTEYLVEENPMLVAKPHLREFADQTARLRDDLARLEKRIERLAVRS